MVESTFYLALSLKAKPWKTLGARLAHRKPTLKPGEVAVELRVQVPLAMFQRPTLRAKVVVPDGVPLQQVITAEVQDNIARVLNEQLGLRMEVSADE